MQKSQKSEAQIPGLKDYQWVTFLKKWMFLSLCIHLIAGVRSVGFFDSDEHFQILEFLNYSLGRIPSTYLAIEFTEMSRSWFQPTLYEGIARALIRLGLEAPFAWATVFRCFNAFVGWLSLVGLSVCSYSWFEKQAHRKWAMILSCVLYFIPFIHARTSSESLGGSFYFLGVSLFLILLKSSSRKVEWIRDLGVGVLFGFAFLSRFQMGIMILGFGSWAIIFQRLRWSVFVRLALGFILVFSMGVLADHRGYGVWTLSVWNYFRITVLEGKLQKVELTPWWFYFQLLQGDVPLIGSVVAIGVILGWIFRPWNLLTLSTLPFVLIHFFIGHKETRYLFPLVSGVPFLLMFAFQGLCQVVAIRNRIGIQILHRIGVSILILNCAGLLVASLKPVTMQPFLHNYIFEHRDEIRSVDFLRGHPFQVSNLPMYFYLPAGIVATRILDSQEFDRLLKEGGHQPRWLSYPHFELPEEFSGRKNCTLRYSVFPDWLKYFMFLPGIRDSANKSSLFECRL